MTDRIQWVDLADIELPPDGIDTTTHAGALVNDNFDALRCTLQVVCAGAPIGALLVEPDDDPPYAQPWVAFAIIRPPDGPGYEEDTPVLACEDCYGWLRDVAAEVCGGAGGVQAVRNVERLIEQAEADPGAAVVTHEEYLAGALVAAPTLAVAVSELRAAVAVAQ
jgi:hypothetical protein